MTPINTKRNCSDCGEKFDAYDIEWMGREIFRQQRCEKCTEAAQKAFEDAEKVKLAESREQAQQEAFTAICPPLYRDTEASQLHPKFREIAMNWRYSSKGLGLVGIAGTGKTRAAYLLIQRMLTLGYTAQATNSTSFAKLCVEQFTDDKSRRASAEKAMKSIYRADIWLLDDLGKQRMTERTETELYAVLEHRSSQKLPTIWTANAESDALRRMFSDEHREPIMRRLIDFTTIVAVWENEVRALKK